MRGGGCEELECHYKCLSPTHCQCHHHWHCRSGNAMGNDDGSVAVPVAHCQCLTSTTKNNILYKMPCTLSIFSLFAAAAIAQECLPAGNQATVCLNWFSKSVSKGHRSPLPTHPPTHPPATSGEQQGPFGGGEGGHRVHLTLHLPQYPHSHSHLSSLNPPPSSSPFLLPPLPAAAPPALTPRQSHP